MTNLDPTQLSLLMQEKTGLSAGELLKLSMREYGRIREDVLQSFNGPQSAPDPSYGTDDPSQELQPPAAPAPAYEPGSEAEFLAWRSQRTSGGEGTGIMNSSAGSASDAWISAASGKSGRTAYGRDGNTVESPRISMDGRYENHEAERQRLAGLRRTTNPTNAWQG